MIKKLNNNPSLFLKPSGLKEGKIYSMIPINATGDFTFERNSTTTRVNSEGLIESVDPNVPRIDYSTGDAKILIEPQRTNYIKNNVDLSLFDAKGMTPITTNDPSPVEGIGATRVDRTFEGWSTWLLYKELPEVLIGENRTFAHSIFLKYINIQYFIVIARGFKTDISIDVLNKTIHTNDTEGIFDLKLEEYPDDWIKVSWYQKLRIDRDFYMQINSHPTSFVSNTPDNIGSMYIMFPQGEEDVKETSSLIISDTDAMITRVADNAYINNFTPKYSNRILNNKLSINDFSDFILPQQSTKYGFSFDDLIGVNTYDNFNINEVEYYNVDVDTTNFREGLKDDTTLSLFPSENNTVGSVRTLQDDSFDFDRNSTATRVNKEGLIESVGVNEMRVDYSTGEGSILIEPQRTNYIEYSEDLSNSYWDKSSLTLINDNNINPSGELNSTIVKNNESGFCRITTGLINFNGNYTISFYIKKIDNPYISVRFLSESSSIFQINIDNPNNNSFGGYFKSVEVKDVENGWVKVFAHIEVDTTISDNLYFRLSTEVSSNSISYNSSMYIYGIQLEEGSYPTSYIPTNGTIQTRVKELLNRRGDFNIFPEEGTIFLDFDFISPLQSRVSLNKDTSTDNAIRILLNNSRIQLLISKNGTTIFQDVSNNNFNIGDRIKVAITYSSTEAKFFLSNGETFEELGDASFPEGSFNNLNFHAFVPTLEFNQRVNNFQIFNRVLTDQEAINLTTI